MFVALGLLDLLSGPTISPALDDLARETTPFQRPHDRNSKSTSGR